MNETNVGSYFSDELTCIVIWLFFKNEFLLWNACHRLGEHEIVSTRHQHHSDDENSDDDLIKPLTNVIN